MGLFSLLLIGLFLLWLFGMLSRFVHTIFALIIRIIQFLTLTVFSKANGLGSRNSSTAMSAEEAYEILGLTPGCTSQEVIKAHHRIMLKLHPDQGGTNYFAIKINQAKNLLLKHTANS